MLDPPRAGLRARIAARFEAMVEEGGLAEALALKDLDPALPAARLLGLRPLIALAQGRLTKAEALSRSRHRNAAIRQAPDDLVSPSDGGLCLV